MPRRHLLYIAFLFPPSRSSGVYRALATVEAFVEAGWDVTVLTTTSRFFEEEIGSVDESLLDLIPDGVVVERVPFSFRGSSPTTDIREFGWLRGNFPLLWSAFRRRTSRLQTSIDVLRGRSPLSFAMTDRYVTWIEPVVAAARAAHSRHPIDHVLATGNPYAAFEAARVVSTRHGVEFTIDYRDPWAFDMRTGGLAKLTEPTFAAEERIIDEAFAVIQVNEAIAEAYTDRYPSVGTKQHVVVNGYDQSSIPPVKGEYSGGPIQFGMLGTVTDLWPLGPLFEAWYRVKEDLPPGSMLRLGGHLGYFQWSAEPLLSSFPLESAGFRYEGSIPKSELARFYQSLDVVIVPLFGGPMVTAGKVLEVAALGVPIVCIQPRDGGARRFYERHPMAFGADPDHESVAIALANAVQLAKTVDRETRLDVRESMGQYERRTAMRRLVDIVSTGAAVNR